MCLLFLAILKGKSFSQTLILASPTGSTMTANVCKKITAQLTGAVGKQEDVSVQLEALDILSDILSRYKNGAFNPLHSIPPAVY